MIVNKSNFHVWFSGQVNRLGLTPEYLSEVLDCPIPTIRRWTSGSHSPQNDNVIKNIVREMKCLGAEGYHESDIVLSFLSPNFNDLELVVFSYSNPLKALSRHEKDVLCYTKKDKPTH